jgi:simple sugar transport system permease protein
VKARLIADRRLDDSVVGLLRTEHSPVPVILAAVIVFAAFSAASPSVYPTGPNIQAMAFALPEVGILALAVMLSMVIAGIDLSVVGTANLASVAMGELYAHGGAGLHSGGWGSVALGVAVALGTGAACGMLNGLVIGLVGISDILATLATGYLFGGLALAWTGGNVLSQLPADLGDLGTATVVGIPVIFLVYLAAGAIIAILLNRTRFGLSAILVGSNVTAARLSGIRRPRIVMGTYVAAGMLAALAGVIFTARTADVTAAYGASYLLLAVVIAVLGGVDPDGGFGTVLGVIAAAAVLQMLQSGFDVIRANQFLYQAVQGLILIVVLAVNVRARGRFGRPGRAAAFSGEASSPPDPAAPGPPQPEATGVLGEGNILAASETTHRDD